MSTPYEDLQNANLAYHIAIGEIFCITNEEIDPEELAMIKAELGDMAKNVFNTMDRINKLLTSYYGGP